MNIHDKSGVISKHLEILKNKDVFTEDNDIDKLPEENFADFCQRALENIVLNFSENKYARELFIRLEMDGIFQLQKDKYEPTLVEVIYNGKFIPYRLDLASMSPMGFSTGIGTSSSRQLSLAILSMVTNDKEALTYYEEFTPYLMRTIEGNGKKQITYIEVYKWFLEMKREKMKNMVKYVCAELNITQKALSEEIGVSEGTVNRWSAKPDEIPLQTQKTLKLLLENEQLKQNQQKLQTALSLLEEIKNSQNNSL